MSKKTKNFLISFLLIIFVFSVLPKQAHAANTFGNAVSEAVGLINFDEVTVSDTALTGTASSEAIGDISMNGDSYGVTNTSGILGGEAWSDAIGGIRFTGVFINGDTGVFSGNALSDAIGEIDMSGVTTTWGANLFAPSSYLLAKALDAREGYSFYF